MKIRAQADVENAESQQKVAEMLNSPAATHMRQMDTLREICKNQNVHFMFVSKDVENLLGDRAMSKIIERELKEQVPAQK
jgi:F0F1-type ATP synthase delta subunit